MRKVYNLLSFFVCLHVLIVSHLSFSQINGQNYIYSKDTVFVSEDSSIFVVENLGSLVNSSHVESGPRITPDGKRLYFFRLDHPQNIGHTEDIWYSDFVAKDSSWTKAVHMKAPINSYGQDAVHWISNDSKTMLLHNKYYKNGTAGNGISLTQKEKDGWSFPKALKIKGYKNQEVCSFYLNDSMNVLLMCVQQKNTLGHQDIYYAKRKGNSLYKWGKPQNLGSVLNTPGTEATVWLNHSQDTIYFSSNGHPGTKGGMDVYRSVRLDKNDWTSWTKPVNLGAPYNTRDDEYYFSIPDEGDYIYMAHHFSNIKGDSAGQAHSDIVRIRLKELYIEPYLTVKGRLFDEYTKDTLPGFVLFKLYQSGKIVTSDTTYNKEDIIEAKLHGQEKYKYFANSSIEGYVPEEGVLDLTDLTRGTQEKELNIYLKRKAGVTLYGNLFDDFDKSKIPGELIVTEAGTENLVSKVKVDSMGGYRITLPAGKKYEMKFKSIGYITKIQNHDLSGVTGYLEKKNDVFLTPLKEGMGFTIRNIFFEVDKDILLTKSYEELNNLVEIMLEYPYIVVEIQGHTDFDGSDVHNQDLSQRRAQSVVNYLIKNGIPKSQFVAKGYGESKPVATNDTADGKQLNRRVEFKILKINKVN